MIFLVGWLAAKVLPGRGSDFMLELPPLRVPQASNIAVKTLARIEWYLREALPLFILGTLILWSLDRFGGLAVLERAAAPVVVGLLGLPKEAAARLHPRLPAARLRRRRPLQALPAVHAGRDDDLGHGDRRSPSRW